MNIRNQSPHQSLVGQSWLREGCSFLCIAAHNDAILVLQKDRENQPINYIVCHRPEITASNVLLWGAGDYFTIPNYQQAGRDDPMAAALSAAVACLITSQVLSFAFDSIEDEAEAVELLVSATPPFSYDQLDQLSDCVSSYTESVPAYTGKQCIEDVMASFPQHSYRILRPEHTIHI